MKDLIIAVIFIGFAIFIGSTFIFGSDGSLQKAAETTLSKANTAISEVDITDMATGH